MFPFAAIVGQDDLKQCLILCAIDPSIGGVLIRGDKGTAKSTAARGLAKLLPDIEVRRDPVTNALDPYNRQPIATVVDSPEEETAETLTRHSLCPTPFVNLPIGATEDRVLGSLDVAATLKGGGKHVFAPGLLAAANRGILYVDEVNLLPPHLVDVLLDAAAMGVNTIQREGIALTHPAKFMLIGTMNPEEGDLRPQLLDRFGLMVDVMASRDPTQRCEVVRQRMAFERNPTSFQKQWHQASTQIMQQIKGAKDILPKVTLKNELLLLISTICTNFQVDSLRADITLYKTATALAAWEGRLQVHANDIKRAAQWALAHRKRKKPFESPQSKQDTEEILEQMISNYYDRNDDKTSPEDDNGDTQQQQQEQQQQVQGSDKNGKNQENNGDSPPQINPTQNHSNNDDNAGAQMQTFTASRPKQIKKLKLAKPQEGQHGPGRRNPIIASQQKGHYVRSLPTDKPVDIALDATLRAAAVNGLHPDTGAPVIRSENWRRKVRHATTDTLILFVVDASGSMSARQRMEAVKGAVLALLTDAYQQRDSVGVIAFRGLKAEVLLEPTRSVELAENQLRRLPTGGRTPLAHALLLTRETVHRLGRHQLEQQQPMLLIVLSDGKANVPLPDSSGDAWTQTEQAAIQLASLELPTLFLDTETGVVRVGRGQELAQRLNADYLPLDDLSADKLVHTIRQLK